MSATKDGGPAFPSGSEFGPDCAERGMTLRAHYAGEFMGAMITTLTAPETVSNWKFMAREACAAADALIAELAKGAGE